MKRTIAIPAAFLPALDAALDKLMHQIAANEVPMWAQDDAPGWMTLTIERPEPALRLVPKAGAA